MLCFVVLVAFGFVVHGSVATEEVGVYELKKGDFSVKLTNWGATVISVVLPDKNGLSAVLFLLLVSIKVLFFFFSLLG